MAKTKGFPDILGVDFFRDPYPTYRALRDEGRVVWLDELSGWLVTSYAECREVLSNHRRFSSARASRMIEAMVPGFEFEQMLPRMLCDALENDFLFLDPPEHTNIRRLLTAAMRASMEGIEDQMETMAAGLLLATRDREQVDLQREYANLIPALVMGELFGLSEQEVRDWQQWTYEAGALFGASPELLDEGKRTRVLEFVRELNDSMADHLFTGAAQTPLIAFIQDAVKSRECTPEEALGASVQLFTAGVLTTGDVLGMGIQELLMRPSLVTSAMEPDVSSRQLVDEMIRFTSPAQFMHRVVSEDTMLANVELHEGQLIYVAIAAANRCLEMFESPDELDFHRVNSSRHLGFGAGVHHCIGATLGRMELEVGFSKILPELSQWTISSPSRYRTQTIAFRGLESLEVTSASVSPQAPPTPT